QLFQAVHNLRPGGGGGGRRLHGRMIGLRHRPWKTHGNQGQNNAHGKDCGLSVHQLLNFLVKGIEVGVLTLEGPFGMLLIICKDRWA
ncbi:MAG: hypothetical protein ABTR27_09000, partial [Candidatus Competibacter phosphatis]